MASRQIAKGFKRSALTVALGLCFAGTVQAQSSVGSIFGDTQANATVRIENVDTGAAREVTADASGRFALPQLSPGRYRVISGGQTREVRVSVGTGTPVTFAAASASGELETVTVTGASAINPIDVSSVESTTVFTAEQIQALPVSRDVTNVALLAPGTVRGDTGLGNLASFGGASVAENGYYINGFDVTNLRSLLSYAQLPFESISEQQVKTGGYGAEYGRSLGGVINIVTKRGTNEWKGGGSVYWEPNQLRSTGRDAASRDPESAPLLAFRSADEFDNLEYNAYAGGPLIKDKLFMFGLVTGRHNTSDTFEQNDSEHESNTSPSGLLKIDWNITDDHLLEFTGIYNKETLDRTHYDSATPYSRSHDLFAYDYEQKSGGTVMIGKYTGYLTDSLTLSAQYGDLKYDNPYIPGGLPGEDCPTVYGVGLVYLGCWPAASFAAVRPVDAPPDTDRRKAWRIDLDWRIGDHAVRAGLDSEEFVSEFTATNFAGGVYYRYFDAPGNGTTNGVPNTQPYVRRRLITRSSGGYKTTNEAAYLEDSWNVTDNLLLYGGIRLERFDNKNADGVSFVKSDDLWAPRLGFSWDVNGDSTFKVFGNAGRYFIPVANNTSIRASGAEATTTEFFQYTAVDPITGAPTLGAQLGPLGLNGSFEAPNPATVASANLSPMYQDEYILGMQMALNENWNIGLRGIKRKIKDGFDDTCAHQPLLDWATDNGYTNFDPDTAASCYIVNPGRDAELALDLNNDGTFTTVTIPAAYFGLPQYRRDYTAVEFFFERMKSDKWSLQGSYTYAKSKGNAEGYVNSTLEQADAGITQDFDFAAFGEGAYGYLPNDRRHTVKVFGTYDITDQWRVGANMIVQSGRPVNCNGFIPENHPSNQSIDFGSISAYSASSFYCHDAAGVPHLGNRGDHGRTPWSTTFDANIAWTPDFADSKLTLQMDVFNLLGNDQVTEYVETGDKNRAAPVASQDYLLPINYTAPRYVRFSARYDF
ncbi:Oar protein [Lysobacter dokdonensis DS-58]|uniref:Oar protein n=1 Tax=Lysobacter dokdonensis DS-58 TaxID=1300345 RepID=A0A0A2WGI0_9GAMM|nr:TonB-dependent receptor [Lysobacter dokdonensis]KGQ17812.1 Oar protein [Lysobacter dokdonensis DS-58]